MNEDKIRTPSQMTKDAKAVIQLAFEDLGGLPRLVEWANNPANLGAFYSQIWSKIIPKDVKSEITGKGGKALQLEILGGIDPKKLSDEDLGRLVELTRKCIEDDSSDDGTE